MCAGGLLAVAGSLWSTFAPGRMVYMPEQAQEYEDAYAAVHAATISHEHDELASASPDAAESREARVAKARERFERAKAELDEAQFVQNELGKWLLGVGLATLVAFGIGYLASRP
jgi:hypothetical protein